MNNNKASLLFKKLCKIDINSLVGWFILGGALVGISGELYARPKKFEWKLEKNDVIELNEFHDVLFRVLGSEVRRQDKNKITLIVDACTDRACRITGKFDTYVRYGNLVGPFKKEKTYESQFFIQKNGIYIVPDEYAVPNLRSVPGFSDKSIEPGESWTMPAEESFDFDSGRFKIPVTAEYTLFGEKNWEWNHYKGFSDKIQYSYPIYYDSPKISSTLPNKVFGMARGTVFFNEDKGIPEYKESKLSYTFVYPNGKITEANFHIHGVYLSRKSLSESAKNELRDSIRKELGIPESENIESNSSRENHPIEVRKTDEGISISMDSILFDTDKYDLKKSAWVQLEKIANVLKKYPEREIRISGHTDNKGNPEYNQKLSENRAKTVLDALGKKLGLPEEKLSFQGFGDSKPIAFNSTEEGRSKNRRVDITLIVE